MVRQDYLTGNHVLIAEERALRPQHFKAAKTEIAIAKEHCPFCPGNEAIMTEILFETPDQQVRIIPNMYPAVHGKDGIHQVIIDTLDHSKKFHEISQKEMANFFIVMRDHLKVIYQQKNVNYAQIFKNQGSLAGASIVHSHWQLMGITFVPQRISQIQNRFYQYYNENNHTYLSSILSKKDLIIAENNMFFAYCPYAPLYSYGIQIAPKRNVSHYYNFDNVSLNELAMVIKQSLQALDEILHDISYNICFIDAPKGEYPHSHFFIEIIPRSGTMAGFEFATECFINPFPPEKVAAELKDIIERNKREDFL